MIVVCPDCGKRFSAQPNWHAYEKLVAELCGGQLAPPGTNGHDVIDPKATRYQVKMANERDGHWTWFGRFPNAGADFYVLFRVDFQGNDTMYILPEKKWDALGRQVRQSDFVLNLGIKGLYKIADYQCDANKSSFMSAVARMMGDDSADSDTTFQFSLF